MIHYSVTQWLIIFFLYCFFGWCYETAFVSITEKRFINRGFLRSPFLPIYGFGAVIMIISGKPFMDDPVLMFLCGAFSATLLEYITGCIMEMLFKINFWDYSDCRYNISGKICAEATLLWGFMTLLVNYKVHIHIEKLVLKLNENVLNIIVVILLLIFITDCVISVKSAIDIKNTLIRLTEIRVDIRKHTERLNQNLEKNRLNAREHITKLHQDNSEILKKIGFFKRDFINAHPNAKSKKFKEALSELKEHIRKKN